MIYALRGLFMYPKRSKICGLFYVLENTYLKAKFIIKITPSSLCTYVEHCDATL